MSIALHYGKTRADLRVKRYERRLAVLGDQRFDCAPFRVRNLLRSVCARRWRIFNADKGAQDARIGSACTGCEQGRAHWEGRT